MSEFRTSSAELESSIEQKGVEFVSRLKEPLINDNKDSVLAVLKEIGAQIHAMWGHKGPVTASYEDMRKRYVLYLSTGTSGTRIFLNPIDYSQKEKAGVLLFPNVNLDHKNQGVTLDKVFKKLFGALAQSVGTDESPYFEVKIVDPTTER